MAKKKALQPGVGKLLDAWVPPDEAGDAIGCIATSFTFNAAFFEEECLGSFIGLETNPTDDGPAYLIEREDKLAKLACAAVLVDAHHCRGMRSLRWDLVPARLPGIQHAKVTLLVWAGWVRLVIGSANLTEDGYRRNLEVFGVLDYFDGSEAPIDCLSQTLGFLRRAANYSRSSSGNITPAAQRWDDLIARVEKDCGNWGAAEDDLKRASVRVHPVFIEPNQGKAKSCFAQLESLWPGSSPALSADVVSPFFDPPEAANQPASEIWELLRKRGEVSVGFHVTAEDCFDAASVDVGKVLLHAPESLTKSAPRDSATVEMLRVMPPDGRPLHAKGIWLEDDRWLIYQIGSSNFTSPGTGLGKRSNLEANLVYVIDGKRAAKSRKAADLAFPKSESVGEDEQRWKPLPSEDGEGDLLQKTLPVCFGDAVFSIDSNAGPIVTLEFTSSQVPAFSIDAEGVKGAWFDSVRWAASGSPMRIELPWSLSRPPSGFDVRLESDTATSWWPVNAASPDALPPPDELKDLPLEVLLEILSSARPPHVTIRRFLKQQAKIDSAGNVTAVDPHKRVDTSGFLLQRTRRLSWALRTIRERVQRPAATVEMLRWRLLGPVGVLGLADAIIREAKSPDESNFLLAELTLELSRVKVQHMLGCIPPKQHREEIQKVIEALRTRVMHTNEGGPVNLNQYVQSVFEAVKS